MNEELENQGPDCMTCWKKDSCPRAQAGTFCTGWATKPPQEAEHPDAWERGDEYPEGRW